MKIAIVRLSSLGDIVFCMASLQLVRSRFPDAEITWVADSRFADILDYNPDLKRVVKLDLKGLKKRFSFAGLRFEVDKLKGLGPFDLVIDMHGMLKSALVARQLGGERVGLHRSNAKEPLATLFYNRTCRSPADVIGVRRYALLAGYALDFAPDESELRGHTPYLFHAEDDLEVVNRFFPDDSTNVIMVAGTSIAYKEYPAGQMAEVAKGLGGNVLVCHGNDREQAIAEEIAALAANVRVLPRLTLNHLKAAIGRASLVIGGDTGPTHMAWAMNVPSITLFGATPSDCIVPTENNLIIRSGTTVNYGKPDSTDLSIRSIPADAVVRTARRLLGKGEGEV